MNNSVTYGCVAVWNIYTKVWNGNTAVCYDIDRVMKPWLCRAVIYAASFDFFFE